jgi:chromatin remodeling complex protein RSC6
MPRVNNKSSKSVEQVVSSQPEVTSIKLEVVNESEPLVLTEKSTKPKKTRAPKSVEVASVKQEPVVEQQPEPVVVKETVSLEEPVSDPEVDIPVAEQSVEFLAKLQQLGVLVSSIKADWRIIEKKWVRELKVALKQSSKRKRKSVNRAPSGFVKPTRISDELASFLEKPSGSEMARTEVTRDINKYIRTNNLQDKENGRKIIPDSKLATLLKLNETDELTYFNLQRYMSPHFAKATKEVVVSQEL